MSPNEGNFVKQVGRGLLIYVVEIDRRLFACPKIWTGYVGLARFLYCMVIACGVQLKVPFLCF